jgi:hypothetical protein
MEWHMWERERNDPVAFQEEYCYDWRKRHPSEQKFKTSGNITSRKSGCQVRTPHS